MRQPRAKRSQYNWNLEEIHREWSFNNGAWSFNKTRFKNPL